MARDHLIAARAEALFASDISMYCCPTQAAVEAAIRRAIRANGGVRGCVGEVGATYGDYPETAANRMRWARQVIEAIYTPAAESASAAGAGADQAHTPTRQSNPPETGRRS
jgi:hypothetical protein